MKWADMFQKATELEDKLGNNPNKDRNLIEECEGFKKYFSLFKNEDEYKKKIDETLKNLQEHIKSQLCWPDAKIYEEKEKLLSSTWSLFAQVESNFAKFIIKSEAFLEASQEKSKVYNRLLSPFKNHESETQLFSDLPSPQ